MKQKLLVLMLVFALCGPSFAGVVVGGAMGFGKEIDGVGASIVMGTDSKLDSLTHIRTMYSQVNFGSKIDNVGAVLIQYWDLSALWPDFYFGTRAAADYEPANSNIGLAAGIELKKGLLTDYKIYAVGYADIVKRESIQYFVFGMNFVLFQ